MKKLYKTINGVLHYKEAWSDGDECVYHWGIVGSEGESETYLIDGDLLKGPAVDNVLADAVEEGYREIPRMATFRSLYNTRPRTSWDRLRNWRSGIRSKTL